VTAGHDGIDDADEAATTLSALAALVRRTGLA
jgi:hypothetical protein